MAKKKTKAQSTCAYEHTVRSNTGLQRTGTRTKLGHQMPQISTDPIVIHGRYGKIEGIAGVARRAKLGLGGEKGIKSGDRTAGFLELHYDATPISQTRVNILG